MSSPTSRTLDVLRESGWYADVVERWIPRVNIRKDLFGCIDIVAADGKTPIIGVQATSTGNINARIVKSMAEPRLVQWLRSGGRFLVVGWAKRGKQGERKTWKAKWIELLLSTDGFTRQELPSP